MVLVKLAKYVILHAILVTLVNPVTHVMLATLAMEHAKHANYAIRVKHVIHHAILVILVNLVIHAMEHAKHANYAIHVKVLVILVKRAIIYVKRATHVEYFEVMRD